MSRHEFYTWLHAVDWTTDGREPYTTYPDKETAEFALSAPAHTPQAATAALSAPPQAASAHTAEQTPQEGLAESL